MTRPEISGELVMPDTIDLPPSLLTLIRDGALQTAVAAAVSAFIEGRNEASRQWRLEITTARLVCMTPPAGDESASS